MFEKQHLLKGALVLVIFLAALEFLRPYIIAIDVTVLVDWQAKTVVIIQHFFTVTPIALLAGFAWSLFGFARYHLGDETVLYEVNKLYQTWLWFEGMLVIIAVGLPVPYSVAITGITMAIKSVINQMRTPPPLPTLQKQPQAQDPQVGHSL